MKNRFLLILTLCIFLLSNIYKIKADENNLTDNYRIYEPFNLSDTKNIELSGESVIDFSKSVHNDNENKIDGIYNAKYNLISKNNGNVTLKMGITFNSSIDKLNNFSIKLDGVEIPYSLKFLSDKFGIPNGSEFYKDIILSFDSEMYEPVNFNKKDVGILRKFNLESNNLENLKYEITIKYSNDKTKVFLSGGEDIKVEENKNNKVIVLTHELSGKSKIPILYVLGQDVTITTKIFSADKELNSGYKENIEKTSIDVNDFFKNIFLSEIPENVRQRFSEDNLYEIFAENFDKIISTSGYDRLGILKTNFDKQIVATFEFPIEPKVNKVLNVNYPIAATITTLNNINVMKLNLEASSFSTFDNFKNFKYTLSGNDNYKYIIDSNVKYKNNKSGSEILLTKAPSEVITNLVNKDSFVKGISKRENKSYTNYVIIFFGIFEVLSVLYLKNIYFSNKKMVKNRKIKNRV